MKTDMVIVIGLIACLLVTILCVNTSINVAAVKSIACVNNGYNWDCWKSWKD